MRESAWAGGLPRGTERTAMPPETAGPAPTEGEDQAIVATRLPSVCAEASLRAEGSWLGPGGDR